MTTVADPCVVWLRTDELGATLMRAGLVPADVQQQAARAYELLTDGERADIAKRLEPMPPKQKPGKSRQDYRTPVDFLTAVKLKLGIRAFALDVAASAENAVADRSWTVKDDALKQSWKAAGWSWLNPPFAHLEPWVERASQQSRLDAGGAHIAMLVPAGVGSNWWQRHVDGKARVLLLNGRITFVGETTPYIKDCCLLLYGPYVWPAYEVWTWPLQLNGAA